MRTNYLQENGMVEIHMRGCDMA